MALENSGFQVKDIVTHVFESGFPKSQSVAKMIVNSKRTDLSQVYKVTQWIRDKKIEKRLTNKKNDQHMGLVGSTAHWTARPGNDQAAVPSIKKWKQLKELLGQPPHYIDNIVYDYHKNIEDPVIKQKLIETSKKWQGWGTALKPASEHWILVQKPIQKQNVAANVLNYGTGAVNIDASRIASDDLSPRVKNLENSMAPFFGNQLNLKNKNSVYVPNSAGRFPSNFVLSKDNNNCPVEFINKQSGKKASRFFKNFKPKINSSFYYCPKPTSHEKGFFNTHPTVKPLALMKYLIKMITPSNGIVLDPFMGSGTTGVASLFENFYFVGIEKNTEYFDICRKRIHGVQNKKLNK